MMDWMHVAPLIHSKVVSIDLYYDSRQIGNIDMNKKIGGTRYKLSL